MSLRSKSVVRVVFGFGDASGSGLGLTFNSGPGFTFRIGVWGSLDQDESSNWKEFTNVVESLEEEGKTGNLENTELFVFTDNTTVEACSFRGSSSSPKLLDLIIRLLRVLSLTTGAKLNIFHVAGTRMIAQGTDGVSRGCLTQDVMAGESMCTFIPIHQPATKRSQEPEPWIRSWSGEDSIHLTEMEWFEGGYDIVGWSRDGLIEKPIINEGRTYLWCPPPFAADMAMAEMRRARIKRQTSAHVFVCPRLCSHLWLKQLHKASDIVFQVPPNQMYWPKSMHEPLLIGILFPFVRSKPWQLRGSPKMHEMGRKLRGMYAEEKVDAGNILCQLWKRCIGIRNMLENVVRKVLLFSADT